MYNKIIINLQNWVAHYEIIILHLSKTILLDTYQIGMTGITLNSRLCLKDKIKTTLSKKLTNNYVSSNFYYPPNIGKLGRTILHRYKKNRDYACLQSEWSLPANTLKIKTKRKQIITRGLKIKLIKNHFMS